MPSFRERLQHSWNAFLGRDTTNYSPQEEAVYYYRPDRPRLSRGNEKSIVTNVYNRIAMDVAQVKIVHVKLDENERYLEKIKSGLNNALNVEANLDQAPRAFKQDIVLSMFDEGCVAVVPVKTNLNPILTGGYDILELRTGKIIEWRPHHVKVRLYNEDTGKRQDVILPKSMVAIIENPLYAVMNEPNSTLQRLIRKLILLDQIDEQSGAGKLDMIIQLPYVIRSEARKKQAEERRKDLEMQLAGSKYGIAYADGTERIVQLNRPVENQLMKQIEYLTSMLYSQLGITEGIFNGTASESEKLEYYNRTVEPILAAITEEFHRKFLTKTARTQNQAVIFLRNYFQFATSEQIAEIADKFTRNEILTPNEIRMLVGYKPSDDPKSDELRNRNINEKGGENPQEGEIPDEEYPEDEY